MCPFIYNFMKVSIEHVKKVEKLDVAMDVWHVSHSTKIYFLPPPQAKLFQRFQ